MRFRMNIETFMKNYGLKEKKTVIKWINKALIPGANLSKNYIPNSARPPYTKARAKNVSSIYCSMVKACLERRHILPKLYRLCDDEFNGYIEQLVRAGLITKRTTDNIQYYDATISATQYKKKFILDAIEACTRGIAEGTTNALVSA